MQKIVNIHYTSDFQKAYKKLPRDIQNLVNRKDKIFRNNPFYPGLNTHKLHPPLENFWSFWITRNYRVLFEFKGNIAIFYDVDTHNIYK